MNKDEIMALLERTRDALEANQMQTFIAENAEEAKKIALSLINKGDTVTHGGAMTLSQIGMREAFTSGDYNYLDRQTATPEQVPQIYREAFSADAYFSSANAITEDGALYNVDGNSNRIAAIAFGPKRVIIIAGYNKIVPDLSAAAERVRKTAAPLNAARLGCEVYCAKTGHCTESGDMNLGCRSVGRICCNYLVSSFQRDSDRVKVILVAEKLGL